MQSCQLFSTKNEAKSDIILEIPGHAASICGIASESVCSTLRLAIADPYIHIKRCSGLISKVGLYLGKEQEDAMIEDR